MSQLKAPDFPHHVEDAFIWTAIPPRLQSVYTTFSYRPNATFFFFFSLQTSRTPSKYVCLFTFPNPMLSLPFITSETISWYILALTNNLPTYLPTTNKMNCQDDMEITPAPPLYEDTTWKERSIHQARPVVGSLARTKTTPAKTMKEKREEEKAAKKAEKEAKRKPRGEEGEGTGRRYRFFRWVRNLFWLQCMK